MSATASAEPGLDLAVLIDHSASMAGHTRNGSVLLRMTLDLLVRNAQANRVEHRLAVIGFGSSATVDMPFRSVRPGDLPQLRGRVDALRYERRGETDLLGALLLAEKLFRAVPASSQRRRAIVLLTDGVPYVRGADMSSYRASLRKFVMTHLTPMGITVDVLLVGGRERALWDGLAHVARTRDAPDELLPQAHGVIARLAGTRTSESAPAKTDPSVDALVVPPYLEIIVFDIFHASRDASVQIFPPGSTKPIRAGADGVESLPVGDVLATLVVPRPMPGEWIIHRSRADRVRILSQQFFPRGVLSRPAETETPCRRTHVPLLYRVLDGSGRPLEELHDYPLSLEVTLTHPNGATSAVAMERDRVPEAAGFRSAHDPLCELAGRYWTDVRITALDAKGNLLEVFRDRWSGFSVASEDCHALPRAETTLVATSRSPLRLLILALLLGMTAIAAQVRQKTKS